MQLRNKQHDNINEDELRGPTKLVFDALKDNAIKEMDILEMLFNEEEEK